MPTNQQPNLHKSILFWFIPFQTTNAGSFELIFVCIKKSHLWGLKVNNFRENKVWILQNKN